MSHIFATDVLLAAVLVAAAPSGAEQTSFGSEIAIDRPVQLPADVLDTLVHGDRAEDLKRCLAEKALPISAVARYFVASAIDMNGDGRVDLVVTAGTYCLQGAHATPIWIFLRTESGHREVFEGIFDGLEIKSSKPQGMRDVVAMSHNATQALFTSWVWDGTEYRARECWWIDSQTGKRTEGTPEGWQSVCTRAQSK